MLNIPIVPGTANLLTLYYKHVYLYLLRGVFRLVR